MARLSAACPVAPTLLGAGVDRACDLCAKPLPTRRSRWCSDACSSAYHDATYGQHDWKAARYRAIGRDGYRCVKCGSDGPLEVNHIDPRAGRGYGFGCWNHLDNLETLCHPCHVAVTNQQRADRSP